MSFARLRRVTDGVRTRLSFPLLVKELTETAARRRTYVLRVIYAVALYAVFALMLPSRIWNLSKDDLGTMGIGRELFSNLTYLQTCGIALFLPALMCGRITQEKERDSLVLLLLTELRPWSIVWQKYLGGLVPMLSFLLLGLPLAGVAYSLGGLDRAFILQNLGALLLTCLQLGALALLCSAWCRSTVGAFLLTYVLGAVMYWGPYLALMLAESFGLVHWSATESASVALWTWALAAPAAVFAHSTEPALYRALLLTPALVSILLFLVFARLWLVRRAFVPPTNFLRRLFERIDGWMKRANRVTGGIVFWHDSTSLPADAPVFWRETQRRVLGKPHYLIRLLYAVEIPTVLLCIFVLVMADFYTGLPALAALLGLLGALLLSVHAVNSVVSERIDQTLEVLLTTPLSAYEIVQQKERALWRLQLVVAAPLLTVFAFESGSRFSHPEGAGLAYSVCAVLLVAIYLPMITWLSLWIGLRVRTRFQAIVTAVSVLAVWAALAPLLFILEGLGLMRDPRLWIFIRLLSPASALVLNELPMTQNWAWGYESPWPVILVNTLLYATIALAFRWRLFANAERCLRR